VESRRHGGIAVPRVRPVVAAVPRDAQAAAKRIHSSHADGGPSVLAADRPVAILE
jgi:hypothetical protein